MKNSVTFLWWGFTTRQQKWVKACRAFTTRDLAFFRVLLPDLVTSMQGAGTDAFDTPSAHVPAPRPGLRVKKWGRSTGFTTGEISSINRADEPIPYQVTSYYGPNFAQTFRGTVYFHNIIEVVPDTSRPFSLGGDSGALVVTHSAKGKNRAIGVVIAGDKNKSIVLPIKPALDQYDMTLLSGHNIDTD